MCMAGRKLLYFYERVENIYFLRFLISNDLPFYNNPANRVYHADKLHPLISYSNLLPNVPPRIGIAVDRLDRLHKVLQFVVPSVVKQPRSGKEKKEEENHEMEY